jgi:hypothetical protein
LLIALIGKCTRSLCRANFPRLRSCCNPDSICGCHAE